MKCPARKLTACLGLGLTLGAVGVSVGAGTACNEQCEFPTEEITVTFPSELEEACQIQNQIFVMDGIFLRSEKGFSLRIGAQDLPFPDSDADVPSGTFVRAVLRCLRFPTVRMGRMVVLQNLPALDGKKNPTEDGTRLWYVTAGGGSVTPYDALPNDYALEEVCHEETDAGRVRSLEAMVVMDGPKGVVIRPGEKGPFTIEHGEHAGRYELENVNIVFSDTDNPLLMNFRIRRAD